MIFLVDGPANLGKSSYIYICPSAFTTEEGDTTELLCMGRWEI